MWPVLSLVQLYPISQHALVTACAIHVLWLISPGTFAAQVSLLAILTEFLLLAGGAGLAELLAFLWCRAGGGDALREAADPLPCLVYESHLHNATPVNLATVCLTASAKLVLLQSQQIAPENSHPHPWTDSVSPISTSRAIL